MSLKQYLPTVEMAHDAGNSIWSEIGWIKPGHFWRASKCSSKYTLLKL